MPQANTARRSPTAAELRTWRLFIETANQLGSVLNSRLQSESALSSADYAVLLALTESAGKQLRSSDVGERRAVFACGIIPPN